jgi:hypothetical protein
LYINEQKNGIFSSVQYFFFYLTATTLCDSVTRESGDWDTLCRNAIYDKKDRPSRTLCRKFASFQQTVSVR